jgi:hypothetical protein
LFFFFFGFFNSSSGFPWRFHWAPGDSALTCLQLSSSQTAATISQIGWSHVAPCKYDLFSQSRLSSQGEVGYTYPALHLNWSTRKKKNIFSVFFLTWLRPIESFSVGNLLLTWAWEGLTSTQRGRKQESPSAFKWTSNRAGSSDWH